MEIIFYILPYFILDKSGGKFFIEVRCTADSKFEKGEKVEPNAFILDGHYRRFVVMEELLSELIETGFHVKYAEQEKGFAPFNGDDSEIIRIVAVKESQNFAGGGTNL